jgi:hypothetical protein
MLEMIKDWIWNNSATIRLWQCKQLLRRNLFLVQNSLQLGSVQDLLENGVFRLYLQAVRLESLAKQRLDEVAGSMPSEVEGEETGEDS